ncbi:site-specific DNA-methyltransferase [Nitrosococcus oceani]|uniref:site-specific DNA-methyltransferase n=1 Tax=Nitrosococcus oceani TaxID=1229 RepID=UPI0004E9490E|nr:site-specific DNA-methyltransferase [Nitrosococcus oceani]KFI21392.1 hypothetical protein HW44_15185 [Nitrosococcus oceani]
MKKIQPEEGESADIVSENIERLKELFPEAFSEGGVDFDALRQLLGDAKVLDEGEEKYGLNWHGKKKARQIALTPSTGTLLPCPEESVDWDTTKNLFIEGDNLEVLKLLQKSYANKVKMIYIDPPFNTGKEFVYPDRFQDNLNTYLKYTGQVDDDGMKFSTNTEASGRKHTNWLNMMYPRLKLAKSLLRQDGAIFISIDENEITNLKSVCDEIFGQENFVECIVWNKRIPKNDKGIGNIHEYVLLYVKDASLKQEFTMRKDGLDEIYDLVAKQKKKSVPLADAEKELKKLFKKNGYDRGITLYNALDKEYRLWGKINMSWPNANTFGPDYEVLHPVTNKPVKVPDRGWRWKQETFNEAANKTKSGYQDITELHDGSYMCGKIWFAKDERTQPSSVTYLDDVNTFLLRSILSLKSDGGVEVEKLFDGKSFFSYPKPTSLMKALFSSRPANDGDIYLDFFAGSATSAHALIDMNIEDGINRRYVMVQLPEPLDEDSEAFKAGYKNLSDLAKERLRRVREQVLEQSDDLKSDLGFRVYELSSSNIQAWAPDSSDLEESLLSHQEHLIEGRSEQDVLYELLLKRGVDLAVPIESREVNGKAIYGIGYGVLFACLDESITKDQVEEIGQGIVEWYRELDPSSDTHVFFRDSAFSDDVSKTNMAAILEQNGVNHVRSL